MWATVSSECPSEPTASSDHGTKNWELQGYDCEVPGVTSSCLANNQKFDTLAEAWCACGSEPLCNYVMYWAPGPWYHMRRTKAQPHATNRGEKTIEFYDCGVSGCDGLRNMFFLISKIWSHILIYKKIKTYTISYYCDCSLTSPPLPSESSFLDRCPSVGNFVCEIFFIGRVELLGGVK